MTPRKAYIVNPYCLYDRNVHPDKVFYGTRNEARKQALEHLISDGYQDFHGDEFTYITSRIKRAPEYDEVLYNGEMMSKAVQKEKIESELYRYELNKTLNSNPGKKAYIKKRGLYYRPNCCGYTDNITEAGIYPIEKAVNECLGCDYKDNMQVVICNPESHNKGIEKQIRELQRKLINA